MSETVRQLTLMAEKSANLLKSNDQTIAVAESSAGGLVSASLLSVPGASSYFLGGGSDLYARRSPGTVGTAGRDCYHACCNRRVRNDCRTGDQRETRGNVGAL